MTGMRLSIGELSKATGVKVVTIRYYEQIGVMPEPPRTEGSYRAYNQDHLRLLHFIRRCRSLGFTLDQVRELLRLSSEKAKACSQVDEITKQHLHDIEEKIADLTRLAVELRHISDCCRGDRLIANCRIVEALSPR
jgi:Cu(I)-responsive transcriptional regulator